MQNWKCNSCHKQFQREYLYRGADRHVKNKVIQMQLKGSGIRDTVLVQGVSPATVRRCLITESINAVVKPEKQYYHQVQIDELWMYVERKKKKVWLLIRLLLSER